MRRLFLLVLLLALAGTSWAIDIKGKWGLGVGTGSFIGSGAEASLIRGKTERTALILDININQKYEERRINPTLDLERLERSARVTFGPRIRRYTRPTARLSPYWDVFAHFTGANTSYGSPNGVDNNYSAGGETGFAGGVEYFTPWYFTLAAHTGLFMASASRLWGHDYADREYRGGKFSTNLGFSPMLQVRVYF